VGQRERPVDEIHPQCPEVLLRKVFRLQRSAQRAVQRVGAAAQILPIGHHAPGARRSAAPMNLKNIINAAQIEIAWAPTSPGDSRGPRSTSRCLVHSALAMVCVAVATSST